MELPLCLDLYGVRFRLVRLAQVEPETMARLFAPFLRPCSPEFDRAIPLEFCPLDRPTDIVTLMTSHLSAQGYFALHAGSLIQDHQAVLLIGQAGGGKSTTVRLGRGLGWQTAGDDLVLANASAAPPNSGLTLHPYLAALQAPPIKPGEEKGLDFLEDSALGTGKIVGLAFLEFGDSTTVSSGKVLCYEALVRLSSQLLWSPEPEILARQRRFLENLLRLPQHRLCLGPDLVQNPQRLQELWPTLTR